MSARARRACDAVQQGTAWFSKDLRQELRKLKYPLAFMDFETLYPGIPRYEGMRPYDHIPFQWSVHRQESAYAELEHFEYLATDNSDPRRPFTGSLSRVLGGKGNIVVYNRSFESSRLGELAAWLPEYSVQIDRIQNRLWDLLPVVRSNVYHPGFRGSYSIKSVLPALIPGMTYEGMDIANGEEAGLAWDRLTRGALDDLQKRRLRAALLRYCGQDTRAMAHLIECLRGSVASRSPRAAP